MYDLLSGRWYRLESSIIPAVTARVPASRGPHTFYHSPDLNQTWHSGRCCKDNSLSTRSAKVGGWQERLLNPHSLQQHPSLQPDSKGTPWEPATGVGADICPHRCCNCNKLFNSGTPVKHKATLTKKKIKFYDSLLIIESLLRVCSFPVFWVFLNKSLCPDS